MCGEKNRYVITTLSHHILLISADLTEYIGSRWYRAPEVSNAMMWNKQGVRKQTQTHTLLNCLSYLQTEFSMVLLWYVKKYVSLKTAFIFKDDICVYIYDFSGCILFNVTLMRPS